MRITNSGEIMSSPRSIKNFDVIAGSAAHDADQGATPLDLSFFGVADPQRGDSRRNLDRLSTLIRHAALLALSPSPLAIPVIESSFAALLMFPVSFLALLTPRLLSAGIAAVTMSAIATAADVENGATPCLTTEPLSIDNIDSLAHPDLARGLDKFRLSVRGLHHLLRDGVVAYSNHRHLDLSRFNGWGPSLFTTRKMRAHYHSAPLARMMLMDQSRRGSKKCGFR
jgi:hypothetical protein